MQPRNLKNYDKYLQKIELYAKALEIELERKTEPGDGMYVPSRRVIRIDPDLDESREIATLLHELGHALDDHLVEITPANSYMYKAYTAVYEGEPTEMQLRKVIECEQTAWDIGRRIAKSLRIPLGKWYDYEEQDALKHYKEG